MGKVVKKKYSLPIIIVVVFLSISLIVILIQLIKFVPYTQTRFSNYERFRECCIGKISYQEVLYGTATDLRYYLHKAWALEYSAYYISLPENDYENYKMHLCDDYASLIVGCEEQYYSCDKDELEISYIDNLSQDRLAYIQDIIPNSSDVEDYYYGVLIYDEFEIDVIMYGFIYNDKTNSIIEFSYNEGRP